jgi:superfamily I DNA and/or RNA helicase/ribosomal protein S1
MNGKVIIQNLHLGFIEFDIDKRIPFYIEEYPEIKIGDTVLFDISTRKTSAEGVFFQYAINIQIFVSRIQSKQKIKRLGKLAGEYNYSIFELVNKLKLNGFDVDPNPNTKLTEEQILILENCCTQELKTTESLNNHPIERGTIIETSIRDIIHPSLVVLDFFNGQNAILPLNNLSWNKSRSERVLHSLKKGEKLEVVIIELDNNKMPLVSRKHLLPRPSETIEWQDLKVGGEVKGKIVDVLINEVIVELENGFFGVVRISEDFNTSSNELMNFTILYKDLSTHYLGLSKKNNESIPVLGKNTETHFKPNVKKVEKVEQSIATSKYHVFETDLRSLNNFENSTYYSFCSDEQADFIEKAFESNPTLFASSVEYLTPLYVQFAFGLPAWESDFQNKLIPYLEADGINYSDKASLEYLSNQKYWIRINRFIKNDRENVQWVLFNEELMLNGFVEEETNNFKILGLTIKRTRRDKSLQKSMTQANGTFLFDSKVIFIGPSHVVPFDSKQTEIFNSLDLKSRAFDLIKELKKETGALLLAEGQSLHIFDKFLEYQEDLLKKGKGNNRITLSGKYRRVYSDKGDISILIDENLEEFCTNDELTGWVVVRTMEESSKEGVTEELVVFSDALLEIVPNGSQLHFKGNDLLLLKLNKGFTIEPKISTRQFSVQREVIQDFFSKKIKLQHIESLLLKPEKILPPQMPNLNFYNETLALTERENPENNQVNAVKKSVGNKNVFLVQGPPGTGKTTVIAEIIKQLTKQGEKILVTSQTHIAVDNVLEKITEIKDLTLLRIGNIERVHPNLRQYQKDKLIELYQGHFESIIDLNIKLALSFVTEATQLTENELIVEAKKTAEYPDALTSDLLKYNLNFIKVLVKLPKAKVHSLITILKEWKSGIGSEKSPLITPLMYSSIDVVFATCIGVRTDADLIDYKISFDTVIIDEAGKANLSESIAAIAMAKKVILVGDQMQLPPFIDGSLLDPNEGTSFVNSKYGNSFLRQDVEHSLKTSFFEFLVNRMHGNLFPITNIEMLNYQHRMHPDIGQFISDAFYEGKVKMGQRTAQNVLPMPIPFEKQLVFLDTSTVENPFETKQGISVKNDVEAQCIVQLVVPKLLEQGLSPRDFAIVAPYKSQVSNIKEHLKTSKSGLYQQIDVSTLDSFQGMEFDVIVFSFTRSAIDSKVGFLDDARRLNVAFSRAKKKLILIGNSETLTDPRSHYDQLFNYTSLFKNIVRLCKNEEIGNFVNVTDYTSLESKFKKHIPMLDLNRSYECILKTSFETPNYTGHIFFIGETGLEAMFRDDDKNFEYESDITYELYISKVDEKNEKIYLSPKKPIGSDFFKNQKVGNEIKVTFKRTISEGYIFEIEPGLDCLFYDPEHSKEFIEQNEYNLYISSILESKRRVQVSETKKMALNFSQKNKQPQRQQGGKLNFDKADYLKSLHKGQRLKAKYKNSAPFGHFFELTRGVDGLLYDSEGRIKNLKVGEFYEVVITRVDYNQGKISLSF